jgi:2-dehydropantoate 2-reductase
MKICVFGAGAIGGHLAVRLAYGGAEVSVVARGPQLAAIRNDGLTIVDGERELNVALPATADPSGFGPQDAVLVTVKAPALPSVAATIAPLLREGTPVAFVMNGIPWFYFHGIGGALEGRRLKNIDPDDALWRVVGPERAIAGVVYAASTVIRPGVIELENPNSRVVLGEADGRLSERVEMIAAHINAGGMKAEVSGAIRDAIWNKLLNNLASGSLAVLAQATIRRIYEEKACVAAARRIMEEAAAIATAVGARPDPDHDKRLAHGRGLDHKPSILQDLELGRPMEIDGIFGVALEMACMAGVRAPTLEMVVALMKVRAREAGLYAG